MTRNAFVIGHPISHSRSPLIHNHWLERYGIDGSYGAFDVEPDHLPEFLLRLRDGEFAGGNATIPLKEYVLPLCDEVDADAKIIGAVNTLVMDGSKLKGFNTDLSGFLGNLDQAQPGWDKDRSVALVLGAGGAARAVLVGLARRGFDEIHILNRTPSKAEALADELPGPFSGHALAAFGKLAGRAALLVNTSAVGMHGSGFSELDLSFLPKSTLVTDIVYTPLETPLLAEARALGLSTVDGLGMLLHQAVPGFAAWFGVTPEVTPELRALAEKSLGGH